MSFRSTRNRENKGITRNNTEMGTVTSPGKEIAAMGAGEYRDITILSPYGINWNPPSNINIQLIKNLNNPLNINGVGCPITKKVKPGEVEIYSKDVSIYLNDNGEIKIDSNKGYSGQFKEDGTIDIKAKGGASIVLNDDGTILLNNHLKINNDGTTVII